MKQLYLIVFWAKRYNVWRVQKLFFAMTGISNLHSSRSLMQVTRTAEKRAFFVRFRF